MTYKLFLLLAPLFLHAYSVSSTDIEYDGQKTLLKGDVSLVHEDLKAQSDRAVIEIANGPYQLKTASLDGHVLFKLAKHGMIFCDESTIDFERKLGLLSVNKGKIRYQGNLYFNHHYYPVYCECDQSEFDLTDTPSNQLTISELRLIGHLKTKINQEYELAAEKAVIRFERDSDSLITKSLELFDSNENLNLAFPSGKLRTNFLNFLLKEEEVSLGKTHGTINLLGDTVFDCERLVYSYDKKMAKIKGPIIVQNSPYGFFKTEGDIEIYDLNPQNTLDFKSMLILKAFSMNFKEHHIESNFGCEVNQFKREVLVDSNDHDSPVIYQYQDIKISSNHVKVNYADDLQTIDLIQFFGKTMIFLKNPIENVQFILCSKIIFYPEEKKIKIESEPLEKILFWTQDENLAMTTEAIMITLDEQSRLKKCEFTGVTKGLVQQKVPSNFFKM